MWIFPWRIHKWDDRIRVNLFKVVIYPIFPNFNDIFSCDSLDKLRNKLPSLEKEIQDSLRFKEFYQFTFNYAKNPGQKGLDLDMALAYWNIVLKGKFRFLEVWTKFLKVILLKISKIQKNAQNWFFSRKTTNDPFLKTLGTFSWTLRRISMMICQITTKKVLGQSLLTISSNMQDLFYHPNSRKRHQQQITIFSSKRRSILKTKSRKK